MTAEVPTLENQPKQATDNQIRFLINVASRYWAVIVASTVAGMLIVGILGYLITPKDQRVYQWHVDLDVISEWDSPFLNSGRPSGPTATPETIAGRTSANRLAETVAAYLIQEDIEQGGPWSGLSGKDEVAGFAGRLLGMISLEPMGQNGRLRVWAKNATSDEEARRVAEAAARGVIQLTREYFMAGNRVAHDLVTSQLESVRQQLEEARRTEWEYRRELDFVPHSEVVEEMKSMNQQILEASTEQQEIRAKLVEVEEELAMNTMSLPAALGVINDDVVDSMVAELNDLLQEKVTLGVEYQPGWVGLQELEAEIADKQAAILEAVRIMESDGNSPTSAWQHRQFLYQQKLGLQLKLTDLEVRRATLEKIRQEKMATLPALANKSFEHEQLAQQAEHYQKEFDLLLTQKLNLETTMSRGSGHVEWNEAAMSMNPFKGGQSRRIMLNFGIGGFVGFVIGFALAMIWESIDTSIRSIQDITEYIGLEVIGTIPKMKFGAPSGWGRRRGTYVSLPDEGDIDACIVTQHDPKSPVSEAYRQLRTNFLLETVQMHPRTIMVTSAVPAEGKTTTAVNMAVTMADRGMRVVVMDTDLRRPNVHKVLKMERGAGLADVLRGDVDLASVVRPTRIQNLWTLSSGRVPPNPSELIGSEQMQRVMAQLGATFDLIICDAPSILVVTDPVLMATHVDTVILVVSVERAKRETVQRARKLMDAAKAHIAGVVLNGLEASRRHYYYYYYYYDETSA